MYRVSHSKDWKVILLWWGYRFWFLLIFWVLCVHEIGPFMPSLSIFIQLMFCSICGPICKHFLFLSEIWIILNYRGPFKQYKVANQQMDTNLPWIKSGKPKSIKKTPKYVETKKLKIALQKVHSNSFFQKLFLNVYLSSCRGRTTSIE